MGFRKNELKRLLATWTAGCVAGAAVVVVVFWSATSKRPSHGEAYSFDGGIFDTDVDQLTLKEPEDIKKEMRRIFSELVAKPNADLYILKSTDEPCEQIVCGPISNAKAKPFIEAALAHRQSAETSLMIKISLYMSAGSLLVSFLALIANVFWKR
jgi:hypothetical protein